MGNTQSAPEGQKISKPKSIGNVRSSKSASPASKRQISSPIATIPYSSFSDTSSSLASPIYDGALDHDMRQHIRSQLLSSDGGTIEKQLSPQLDLLAVNVARSLSRSGARDSHTISARSSRVRLQNQTSQQSLALERTVEPQTVSTIMHELRKTASPEDMFALRMFTLSIDLKSVLTIT